MGIASRALTLRANRKTASIRTYYPTGTIKCDGVTIYRSQVSDADFDAILEGIASAVVPLRTFVENTARKAFAAELDDLRGHHARAMERLEFEVLERLTRP